MKNRLITLIVTGTIIGATSLAQAQEVKERKEAQQDRIAGGVKNGSLTPHETSKLERKEAKINRETRRDRSENGGKLTGQEKARVNHQQNKVSRDIYRQKHDAQHQ